MKTAKINLLVLMVTTMFFLQPTMAEEAGHRTCNGSATVEAGKMGMVDEAALQAHIDKVKDQMKAVSSTGGARHLRKEELRRHLSNMQAAMAELHNQMYAEGCEAWRVCGSPRRSDGNENEYVATDDGTDDRAHVRTGEVRGKV